MDDENDKKKRKKKTKKEIDRKKEYDDEQNDRTWKKGSEGISPGDDADERDDIGI